MSPDGFVVAAGLHMNSAAPRESVGQTITLKSVVDDKLLLFNTVKHGQTPTSRPRARSIEDIDARVDLSYRKPSAAFDAAVKKARPSLLLAGDYPNTKQKVDLLSSTHSDPYLYIESDMSDIATEQKSQVEIESYVDLNMYSFPGSYLSINPAAVEFDQFCSSYLETHPNPHQGSTYPETYPNKIMDDGSYLETSGRSFPNSSYLETLPSMESFPQVNKKKQHSIQSLDDQILYDFADLPGYYGMQDESAAGSENVETPYLKQNEPEHISLDGQILNDDFADLPGYYVMQDESVAGSENIETPYLKLNEPEHLETAVPELKNLHDEHDEHQIGKYKDQEEDYLIMMQQQKKTREKEVAARR